MNEGAYLPLPSVEDYLDRIGVGCVREASREFLDELIFAHQTHVPFENLDVFDKYENPSLSIPDLFDKVVTRRRGGYCFELNGLFMALLRAIGFDVQAASARILLRPDDHPAITHRATIVRFTDGLYVADVGFGGPQAACAVKVEDGFTCTDFGQTFFVRALSEHWWELAYTGSECVQRPVMRVCTLPSEESDFAALSFFQSQCETSSFRTRRIVSIRTASGAHSIENMTFTKRVAGRSIVQEIKDDIELDQVLSEYFGIVAWR